MAIKGQEGFGDDFHGHRSAARADLLHDFEGQVEFHLTGELPQTPADFPIDYILGHLFHFGAEPQQIRAFHGLLHVAPAFAKVAVIAAAAPMFVTCKSYGSHQ